MFPLEKTLARRIELNGPVQCLCRAGVGLYKEGCQVMDRLEELQAQLAIASVVYEERASTITLLYAL
tara:strand:+ start:553 stop:753 length:201 start_codon:yes stop_codon:yes gene_type:complete